MRRLLMALSACLSFQSGGIQAAEPALFNHPQWRSLLHFDRVGMLSQPRSAVLDEAFFLAEDGQFNPEAELTATLAALRERPQDDESHASCRFPARALWLTQMTGERWPDAVCPDWEAWQSQHSDSEVGLMFASGYLGNPASFFGHLMLHLEQENEGANVTVSRLLDTSLNFGADVPEGEGLMAYMAKGIFGGYEARYSHAPFYQNNTVYSEREMRDLWHYQLALPPPKRELLVAHLFEVIGQDFDYLFLSQNCASRIARTLELVVEEDLTPGHMPWVAPETLVRAISDASIDGQPLLQDAQHVPSRRLQTEWRYQALALEEQQVIQSVWPSMEDLTLDDEALGHLPPENQAEVLDTLLSHVAFLKQTGDEHHLAETERRLLQARLALPSSSTSLLPTERLPLHESTPPALMRVESVYNSELGEAARLTLRPLQYDLLDSNATRMPNAALEIGCTELSMTDEGVRLHRLSLFNITNLHAHSVPLPALPSMAWHASGGIERSRLDCNSCLEGQVTLLAGKSRRFGRHLPFGMLGGQLRTERHLVGPLAPVVQVGMLSDWSKGHRTLLQATHVDALKGEAGRTTSWHLQHRISLGNDLDARMGIESDKDSEEVSLGVSWYF